MPTNAAAASVGPTAPAPGPAPARLLRIQEVAELVGLTSRAIRYYEEVGLLKPAGRSEGDYRQYDADDLERLHFIKAMRDDAGFSLAEIGQLLEDEEARNRSRERFQATSDPGERQAILRASAERLDGQLARLREKANRLNDMIAGVEERRERVDRRLAELQALVALEAPVDPAQAPATAHGPAARPAGPAR